MLKELCAIHAPSGSEANMKDFLLKYIEKNSSKWKVQPTIKHGKEFQDCLILEFGKPRTAIFAHMDSVGYSVGYDNELLKIGGPKAKESTSLVGEDRHGMVEGNLHYEIEEEDGESRVIKTKLIIDRIVERGTTLCYKQDYLETDDYIQSCYLDNRLGIWVALKVAETLENGVIVFSAWEEVGGGSVGYLSKYIYEQLAIQQALIADITWVTSGVKHGKGVAISMRDSGIPRRSFIDQIIALAEKSKIKFQLEVESAGGSDGNAIQRAPYPIDWCFIGAPEDNVHMPDEKVHKKDIDSMIALYEYLMKHL
tara:strand:+ start:19826 stop:20755 length:930 start_codon:yes stop_codon:yes gene_type:complete